MVSEETAPLSAVYHLFLCEWLLWLWLNPGVLVTWISCVCSLKAVRHQLLKLQKASLLSYKLFTAVEKMMSFLKQNKNKRLAFGEKGVICVIQPSCPGLRTFLFKKLYKICLLYLLTDLVSYLQNEELQHLMWFHSHTSHVETDSKLLIADA